MLRKVNAQGLMDLIRANEEAYAFSLMFWVCDATNHTCGTYGCLVGNWAIAKGRMAIAGFGAEMLDGEPLTYELVAKVFSMTPAESRFLFQFYDSPRDKFGRTGMSILRRDPHDREAAINRVRKFLYYKLRKWELLYEEDGRVRESSRRTEGNHHVCRRVLALSGAPVSVTLEPAEGGGA